MIEVEIRAKIKDLDKVQKALTKIGAKFAKKVKQVDRVFGHPMFLDKNTKIFEGGLSGRIRQVDDKILLEFKEIVRRGGGLEISALLDNVKDGLEFLKKLQWEEAFTVAKTREIYKYKNFEICLDKVRKLGKFIEIERLVRSAKSKSKVRKECLKLLHIVEPNAQIIHKKYGDLMQEIINKNKKP